MSIDQPPMLRVHRSLPMLIRLSLILSCWTSKTFQFASLAAGIGSPVPDPVYKMQSPGLFTIAQRFPQPKSADDATCSRMNRLPPIVNSSYSSGELRSGQLVSRTTASRTTAATILFTTASTTAFTASAAKFILGR